jgi:hypothetical protein
VERLELLVLMQTFSISLIGLRALYGKVKNEQPTIAKDFSLCSLENTNKT